MLDKQLSVLSDLDFGCRFQSVGGASEGPVLCGVRGPGPPALLCAKEGGCLPDVRAVKVITNNTIHDDNNKPASRETALKRSLLAVPQLSQRGGILIPQCVDLLMIES